MSNPSSPGSASPAPAYLVVPAGGRGLRMGGGVPKQFRDWQGRPLLRATLEAFLAPGMPGLEAIVLAAPEDRMAEVRGWDLGIELLVVPGGATRQASVAAALAALGERAVPGDRAVLIHDGVRPFPPAPAIHAALAALEDWDGAVLGEASTDTLKRVDPTGLILATEPRELIFRAQTPQAARLATWQRAFRWAAETGFLGTDDVSLLEALGLRVKLIPAPASNRKITHPEDWA